MSGARNLRVGIFGRGKLGTTVKGLLEAESGLELAFFVDKGDAEPEGVDVALDASAAAAVPEHLDWARRTGTNLVIGTTGWDRAVLEGYRDSGVGILVAPNFSLAVAFMRRAALALGRFAALDSGADLSVLERHHRLKADAPSGTAKMLAEALVEACPRYEGWTPGPVAAGVAGAPPLLQVASLRGGTEVGYHEARLEASAESIVFSHEAKSREIFARGALRALRWMAGRKGLFTFDDLAAELIDPLFQKAGAGS